MSSSPSVITLTNDYWRVGLVPATGGSVAFGQVRIRGEWVDVLRPTAEEDRGNRSHCSSFPLVPWSNRIRDGKLLWQGRAYQLRTNPGDGTARHGVGIEYPWSVVKQSATSATLEFSSRDVYGVNFPWTFTARFEYTLEGDRLTFGLSVTNTDHETFPAGLGHHPYFVRRLALPDGTTSAAPHLQINCEQSYDLIDALPVAAAGPIAPRADFRTSRPLGESVVDDCLTGRTSPTVAVIEYPGDLAITIHAGELLSHVVAYAPEGAPFFAVEPVTNVNDAFTLDAQGVKGTGLFLVQPGETRHTEFSFSATKS
ncbi:aldose 1-epimerase [Demequina aurantiaca]|uniref:aldose epimerase family protein n=1 Tax=Demequina aurantiaca TaxID=676200 RepID=UPI003D343F97